MQVQQGNNKIRFFGVHLLRNSPLAHNHLAKHCDLPSSTHRCNETGRQRGIFLQRRLVDSHHPTSRGGHAITNAFSDDVGVLVVATV